MRQLSYWSDLHLNHANILHYCQRPFRSLDDMNRTLLRAWHEALVGAEQVVVTGGDVGFQLHTLPVPRFPEQNWLVFGNHDAYDLKRRVWYAQHFSVCAGKPKSWRTNQLIVPDVLGDVPVRVLVTHQPHEDLRGCDYNVYGHIHDNWERDMDGYHETRYPWLLASQVHLNASVERVGYRPRSLEWLVAQRAQCLVP